ncbi:hypothetical protein CGCSCA4_v000388 [Colletotrichum siamense]|uniref:Uncharacterized protein n=1 Tax=Colletotrichum siamense TaxID=690259 RepID=A0A9P5EVT0_COLSI|nr:hypothetical protein CGCSCA4_v000388 [Colletotrichum siamense]KAF4860400.1 hypothetical protein CGCSCA2_v005443 [Colletotrichum siamense]
MTRRLPWARDDVDPARTPAKAATKPSTSRSAATPQRATPKQKATPTSRNSKQQSSRLNGLLRDRSASTSPPPQPIPEIFMIEGLENDDKYRMVEDELFTIAGQFTAHLHAAEYQRLKTQTKSQNAETIKNISRPVVGSLTDIARRRQEELLRKKNQREALRKAKKEAGVDDESGDETSMPWHGTSLQGLMDSPQKKEVPLTTLTRADSGTKTSLFGGVIKSQRRSAPMSRREVLEEETESESDDLGGPVKAPTRREPVRSAQVSRPLPKDPARPTAKAAGVAASLGAARHASRVSKERSAARPTSSSSSNSTTRTATPGADDGDDEDDIFTRHKNRTARARTPRLGAAKHTSPTARPMSSSSSNSTTATTTPAFDHGDDGDDDDIFTRFKNRTAKARPLRRAPVKKVEPQESRDIIPSFL